MNKKQIIKKISIIILLFILYVYTVAIQSIPNNIIVFEGESFGIKTLFGIKANLKEKDEVIETLSNNQTKTLTQTGKTTVKLSLFENIFLKDISIDVLPKTTVIPVGSVARYKTIHFWTASCWNVRNSRNR